LCAVMECGGRIAVSYEDKAFSLQLFRRKEIWLRCVAGISLEGRASGNG